MQKPMENCPGPEGIAAFIDGGMTIEEREITTAHLADCESCYEIFTETLALQDELEVELPGKSGEAEGRSVESLSAGTPLPFVPSASERKSPTLPARLLIAASLLLALGAGYFFVMPRLMSGATSGELVAEFRADDLADEFLREGWSSSANVQRGAPEVVSSAEAVDLATRFFNLRLAVEIDDREEAEGLLRQLSSWRGDMQLPESDLASLIDKMTDGTPLAVLKVEVDRLEQDVWETYGSFPQVMTDFLLGQWAEAGRQAARNRDVGFLRGRTYHRLTRKLLTRKLNDRSLQEVREISQMLGEELGGEDCGELQSKYEELLGRILLTREQELPF